MTENLPFKPAYLEHFDWEPTIRVQYGLGALDKLGQAALELGGKNVLLVTDQGLIDAGHVAKAAEFLKEAGLNVFIFTDVEENPTTTCVEKCKAFALASGEIDLIVGLGGGSSMDCAKAVNFLLSNGGKMEDYWGKGLAKKPMLPSIGIPTTAGTGSEAQRFALISDTATHRKMACGDIKARFRVVLLDPTLVKSVPHTVAAHSGMDAITHALESYVTSARNAASQMFAREAWRLLERNFQSVLDDPENIEAWSNMQLGAHYSGMAIESSMLGAAHATANPLTARFDVPHGVAVAMMLPHVMRFNTQVVGSLYTELAEVSGFRGSDAIDCLISRVEALRTVAEMPGNPTEFGVREEHIQQLAHDATQQWTGTFNPRPASEEDFATLYRAALS